MKNILRFVFNIFSSATILAGIIISIMDALNKFDTYQADHLIIQTTLILLSFFSATSLYLSHSNFNDSEKAFTNQENNINKLESSINKQIQNAVKNLDGVYIENHLLDEDGFLLMTSKLENSCHCIEHAAFASPVPALKKNRDKYERAISDLLNKNKVTYRYIARLGEYADDGSRMRRLDHIAKIVRDNNIRKYHPYYFLFNPDGDEDPSPSFIIIDNNEVITLYPNSYSEQEYILLIKHPEITKMYMEYFKHLTKKAHELTRQELVRLETELSKR